MLRHSLCLAALLLVVLAQSARAQKTISPVDVKARGTRGDGVADDTGAIHGTRPWKVFGEGSLEIETKRTGENLKAYSASDIRFTAKNGHLYAVGRRHTRWLQ